LGGLLEPELGLHRVVTELGLVGERELRRLLADLFGKLVLEAFPETGELELVAQVLDVFQVHRI
jgi:hypothetical protein